MTTMDDTLMPAVAAPHAHGHACALHAHAPVTMLRERDDAHETSGRDAAAGPAERPVREIIRSYPLIDELLDARRGVFGGTEAEAVFQGYRSHAYHILNFARQWIEPSPEREEKIAIAAVFHDIAAWPDGNLDYLSPSADQAERYLDGIGRGDWKPEMRLMIEMHHKITAYRGAFREWVEPVRRADWCDVSFALMRFGLPRSFVREVRAEFPLTAFYPNHVYKLSLRWMLRHPLNPAPIFRW